MYIRTTGYWLATPGYRKALSAQQKGRARRVWARLPGNVRPGRLFAKVFCQKMLLYYLDSPADSALVVDGLSAVGGAHPGAEADLACPLHFRNLMWVMHDALSRYPLRLSRFPNSRVMIPARPPLDKRFLRQLFVWRPIFFSGGLRFALPMHRMPRETEASGFRL